MHHNIKHRLSCLLDLEIFVSNNRLYICTYFKETDQNTLIPTHSGHRPDCIKNVPRGRFIRIKRNCTTQNDYYAQGEREKRNSPRTVERKTERVAQLERDHFTRDQKKKNKASLKYLVKND